MREHLSPFCSDVILAAAAFLCSSASEMRENAPWFQLSAPSLSPARCCVKSKLTEQSRCEAAAHTLRTEVDDLSAFVGLQSRVSCPYPFLHIELQEVRLFRHRRL
jgi:hypothetical protein